MTGVSYPASMGFAGFSVTQSFDEFDRVISTTDATGTTTATYDALDRPLVVTPPSPQKALTYAYTKDTTLKRWITSVNLAGVGSYQFREDTKGRTHQIENPFSQLFTHEFDKEGKPTRTSFPNGVQELRSYTPRDWLGGIQIQQANGTVKETLNYYYTDSGGAYDQTGRVRGEESTQDGYREFGFTPWLPELKVENRQASGGVMHYGYTANGTRVVRINADGSSDTHGVWLGEQIVWVNRAGNFEPTSGQAEPYTLLQYDANGRLIYRERRETLNGSIQKLEFYWDGADRLRQVKEQSTGTTLFSASYDGEGLRVGKWDAWTGQHDYSWGPGGVLHDSNAGTTFTPGLAQRTGTSDLFFHRDWLGSTRWTSEGADGNSFPHYRLYDSHGQRLVSTGTPAHVSEFGWGGGWGYQSEPGLGLVLMGRRYYDPAIGRFISPDPIGYAGA